jgi:hypothetical protein
VLSNEYLGSDTLVACEVPGPRHTDGRPWRIVAKLPGRQELEPGTALHLGWETRHEHRFDSSTGARI